MKPVQFCTDFIFCRILVLVQQMLNAFVAVIFKKYCYSFLEHDGKVHLILCFHVTSVRYVIPWPGTMFYPKP